MKVDRLVSTFLIAGVLAGCAPSPVPVEVTPGIPTKPTPAKLPTQTPPFDFCDVEQGIAADPRGTPPELATPAPTEVVSAHNPEALNSWYADRENFHEYDGTAYEVVLVPVGYTNQEEFKVKMEDTLSYLDIVYDGLYVNFSYLDKSAPVGIHTQDNNGDISDYNEYDIVLGKLNEVTRVNGVIFIVNSSFRSATYVHGASIVSGTSDNLGFTLAHEAGHHLGLHDAYEAYRPPNHIIESTELFTSTTMLTGVTQKAYRDLLAETNGNVPLVKTGKVCNEWDIYRFYGGRNIMGGGTDEDWSREHILKAKERGEFLLNPIQVQIINNRAVEVVKVFGQNPTNTLKNRT
jgi:hypothetical protein